MRWPCAALRKFWIVALALTLAACASAPPSPPRDYSGVFELQIRIGRFAVIADRSREAIALLTDNQPWYPVAGLGDDPSERAMIDAAYAELYLSVLEFNQVAAEACARGLAKGTACAESFLPLWLKPPSAVRPSADDLNRWSDEAEGAYVALFVALCDQAVPKSGDPLFCSVE